MSDLDILELTKIGNRGVSRAIEAQRKAGVPIVFTRNDIVYFEMPDGSIQREVPEVFKNIK